MTETEISENITKDQADELRKLQGQELEDMDRRIMQLKERQELIDRKEKILDKRRTIEVMMLKQRVQEKEQMLKGAEEIMELRKREAQLDEKRQRMASSWEKMEKKALSPEEMDPIDRTRQWLNTVEEQKSKHSGATGAPQAGSMAGSQTGSQKKIKNLEQEVAGLKQALQQKQMLSGMEKLERMGMVPSHSRDWLAAPKEIPNKQEQEVIRGQVEKAWVSMR